MSSIEDRLLTDISWREDELVIIKTICAQSAEDTPRGRSLRRAYLALLYAHYEGFAKVAWEEYLIEISRSGLPFNRLQPVLLPAFLNSEILAVKSCSKRTFVGGVFDFRARLMDVVSPPYESVETSNLWPKVFEETMSGLGLDYRFLGTHVVDLKALVGRRNDIAHGENVGVTDSAISRLDHAVWEVFLGLTVVITNACKDKSYRI